MGGEKEARLYCQSARDSRRLGLEFYMIIIIYIVNRRSPAIFVMAA